MKNFLVAMIGFVLRYSGPVLTVCHIQLFKHYFSQGKKEPDLTHTVILNNHGVNRYITEWQDQILNISMVVVTIMLAVFFFMIILQLRRGR